MDSDYSTDCFRIKGYDFNEEAYEVKFRYENNLSNFCETVQFVRPDQDRLAAIKDNFDFGIQLHYALDLAALVIGTSYYKTHPTKQIVVDNLFWNDDTNLFDTAYQEGLSQFAYENNLTRADLGTIKIENVAVIKKLEPGPSPFVGRGTLALQSGGKDSILTATLLNEKNQPWTALYISSNGGAHPQIINQLGAKKIQIITRKLDKNALEKAKQTGGLNGHVPVTYINMALALVQAIINGDNQILTSIGHEGAENHAIIKSPAGSDLPDLPVNHQWSKTLEAERLFANYIENYISKDITVSSPLRQYSELKIAELFAKKCWEKYSKSFSSCNQANYTLGTDNSELHWCGKCAKCANSYLLFAPFIEPDELNRIIAGDSKKSLFTDPDLVGTFKGLLGIDGEIKPFECIGEVDELRKAYHMKKSGYPDLVFDVPESDYNYNQTFPHQDINLVN